MVAYSFPSVNAKQASTPLSKTILTA